MSKCAECDIAMEVEAICEICRLVEKLREEKKKRVDALEAIWVFLDDDFPNGTGEDHGTCATDEYVAAARLVEQVVKGGG